MLLHRDLGSAPFRWGLLVRLIDVRVAGRAGGKVVKSLDWRYLGVSELGPGGTYRLDSEDRRERSGMGPERVLYERSLGSAVAARAAYR